MSRDLLQIFIFSLFYFLKAPEALEAPSSPFSFATQTRLC